MISDAHTPEALLRDYLRSIRPRPGFEGELRAALARTASQPHLLGGLPASSRIRWVVLGTVAGVVSASGAALYGIHRYKQKGVA